jgi:chloride channel 7
MFLDMGCVVNTTPYMVPADTSLTKAFTVFRQLGLRHLLVVPRPHQVAP